MVRLILLALLLAPPMLGIAASGAAYAAEAKSDAKNCLTKDQQRSAVSSGKAVPLASALKASRRRGGGDLVRAQLCQETSGALVYVLTVLPRSGKVTKTMVDATDGAIAGER